MLKPLHRSSSASSPSPRFHYDLATKSTPTSPTLRRNSKPKAPVTLAQPIRTHRVQYVDAGTQWSPIMNSKTEVPRTVTASEGLQDAQPPKPQTYSPVPSDIAAASADPPLRTEPVLDPESPGLKRRQTVPSPLEQGSQQVSTKRAKAAQSPVKILPAQYEHCSVEDMVILIANMISELIETNDVLPLRSGVLTRFHSRTPPGISVLDYLQRLAKHATLTPPILLSMVYYIDRLCLLYPAFTITTLTVHRFLITAATVAAKGLSDSFWNNATYARVGGIKLAELGMLELDFLYRVDWKIVPNPETLVDYYEGLVERASGYEIEGDTSSIDEDEESDEMIGDGEPPGAPSDTSPTSENARDAKWKAWMNDVSIQRADGAHEDKPA